MRSSFVAVVKNHTVRLLPSVCCSQKKRKISKKRTFHEPMNPINDLKRQWQNIFERLVCLRLPKQDHMQGRSVAEMDASFCG